MILSLHGVRYMEIFSPGWTSSWAEFNSTYDQSSLRDYMLKQAQISALLFFQLCRKI